MKLNCLIVDDEPAAQNILKDYIADVDFLAVADVSENPIKAGEILRTDKIDLLFLDINMPKVNGLDFLRLSKSLPLTILTTAYSQHALEGYELNVLDYLLKPFSFERFLKASNKAKDYYKKNEADTDLNLDYFFVKSEGKIQKIIFGELICVEAMQNYVILHNTSGKQIVYLTLKMMEDQLPKSMFIKIHKSMIVNRLKIKSIDGKIIDLGTMKTTISQNMYEPVMKEIMGDRLLKR